LRPDFSLQKLSGTLCISSPRREDGNEAEEIKMRSWLQLFSVCAFTILLCSRLSAAADLEAAKRAYQQKDYATAFKEFTVSAKQGNAEAQLYLGKMYFMGQGVLKDPDEAIKWLKVSGQQGNADAQFFLGSIYLLPHKDIAQGLMWLRLSAEQGNQDAQLLLGQAYLQNLKELPGDPVQGDMWLRLAAENNLPFYKLQLQGAEGQMSPTEIAKGKALAEVWKRKHGLRPDQKPEASGTAPAQGRAQVQPHIN